MKKFLCLLGLVFFTSFSATGFSAALPPPPVFELRVYTAHEGKMPDLLKRFREHTCKLFERHGMMNIGYWVPLDATKDGNKLYYVLQHRNREAAQASWKAFGSDPEWKAVQQASEATGPLVVGVESTFLAMTDYSPTTWTLSPHAHVFELRTYTTNDDKLANLDARFRDHTIALFARHGMTNLQYWHPVDTGKGAGHTLVYLLAHESRDAATKSWADFQADPEWVKVRTESEQAGKILVKDGVKSVFLAPTDFSTMK